MWTAQDGRYTLRVDHDRCATSPRHADTLGRLLIFHQRYGCLGDRHNYDGMRDFLRKAYTAAISDNGKALVRYLKQKRAKNAYLAFNRKSREWELWVYQNLYDGSGEWAYVKRDSTIGRRLTPDSHIWQEMLRALTDDDLACLMWELPDCVLLPIYLYDHEIATISVTPFDCRWDMGRVGWIYASRDALRWAYGKVNRKTLELATQRLCSEVDRLASYMRGECWKYTLHEGNRQIDACGGFIGDMATCGMVGYLPEGARHLLKVLEQADSSGSMALAA